MLTFIESDGKIIEATSTIRYGEAARGNQTIDRNDLKTFDAAKDLAARATKDLERSFLATDSGEYVYPRFDVIELPKVGEYVSMGFNGDYYPVGKIKSISKSLRLIVTTDGRKFYRIRETGKWVCGGFGLVRGIRDERNPEF